MVGRTTAARYGGREAPASVRAHAGAMERQRRKGAARLFTGRTRAEVHLWVMRAQVWLAAAQGRIPLHRLWYRRRAARASLRLRSGRERLRTLPGRVQRQPRPDRYKGAPLPRLPGEQRQTRRGARRGRKATPRLADGAPPASLRY